MSETGTAGAAAPSPTIAIREYPPGTRPAPEPPEPAGEKTEG